MQNTKQHESLCVMKLKILYSTLLQMLSAHFLYEMVRQDALRKIKLTFCWNPYLWSFPTWGREESYLTTNSSFKFPTSGKKKKKKNMKWQQFKKTLTPWACLSITPGFDANAVMSLMTTNSTPTKAFLWNLPQKLPFYVMA